MLCHNFVKHFSFLLHNTLKNHKSLPFTIIMKKNILYIIFTLFIFSCKNEIKTPTQSTVSTPADDTVAKKTMADIMAIHDEVMPMVNEIENLQTELKKQLATVKSATTKTRILDKLTALTKADKAMYAWMDGFKTDFEGMSQMEVNTYLEKQKTEVEAMAKQVKAAIAAAK